MGLSLAPGGQGVSFMQRRDLLQWAGATAGLGWAGALQAGAADGLHEVAARSGRSFGFSIAPSYANHDPVASLLASHAGVITAENAMKWRAIEGLLGGRDFAPADAVAAHCAKLGAKLRGHTLAWHTMVPAWLAVASSTDFVKAQAAHLQELATRYAGRIHTWDVLNEAVNPDDKRSDGLRESVLSRLWGVDRYPVLFELARAADLQAQLAYNDYGLEQDDPWCEQRRRATLHLLEQWLQRKTPIDVLGLQAHLDLSRKFSPEKLLRFFDEVASMGLTLQITELDVRDAQWDGDIEARDAAVAVLYREFVQACMSHPAVEMVVMWNVTDADTWVNRAWQGQRRADGAPMRPTLFDIEGQPKPAFAATLQSLAKASTPFAKPAPRR